MASTYCTWAQKLESKEKPSKLDIEKAQQSHTKCSGRSDGEACECLCHLSLLQREDLREWARALVAERNRDPAGSTAGQPASDKDQLTIGALVEGRMEGMTSTHDENPVAPWAGVIEPGAHFQAIAARRPEKSKDQALSGLEYVPKNFTLDSSVVKLADQIASEAAQGSGRKGGLRSSEVRASNRELITTLTGGRKGWLVRVGQEMLFFPDSWTPEAIWKWNEEARLILGNPLELEEAYELEWDQSVGLV